MYPLFCHRLQVFLDGALRMYRKAGFEVVADKGEEVLMVRTFSRDRAGCSPPL